MPTPNALVVADFIYVKLLTWVFVYVAFVSDAYAGVIIGWEAASIEQTRFVESAIRQAAALRARQGHWIDGAIHHSDAGSHYTAIHFDETLSLPVLRPSVGSVGDAYALPRRPSGSTRTSASGPTLHSGADRCASSPTSSSSPPTTSAGTTSSASCTASVASRPPKRRPNTTIG